MDTEPGLEEVEAEEEMELIEDETTEGDVMEECSENPEEPTEKSVVQVHSDVDDDIEDETTEGDVMEENSEHPEEPTEKNVVQVHSDEDDEDSENIEDFPAPQFPLARVKKIMQYGMAAEDDEDDHEVTNAKAAKGQGKGKGNMIITKEAIYLTTLATEHFISVIGQMAGNVTMSSKKKTLTMEHLKRALSDTDAFAFLEGCFQPSVIIGD